MPFFTSATSSRPKKTAIWIPVRRKGMAIIAATPGHSAKRTRLKLRSKQHRRKRISSWLRARKSRQKRVSRLKHRLKLPVKRSRQRPPARIADGASVAAAGAAAAAASPNRNSPDAAPNARQRCHRRHRPHPIAASAALLRRLHISRSFCRARAYPNIAIGNPSLPPLRNQQQQRHATPSLQGRLNLRRRKYRPAWKRCAPVMRPKRFSQKMAASSPSSRAVRLRKSMSLPFSISATSKRSTPATSLYPKASKPRAASDQPEL